MNRIIILMLGIALVISFLGDVSHAQPTSNHYEDCQYKLREMDKKVDGLEASIGAMHDSLVQLLTKMDAFINQSDEKHEALHSRISHIDTTVGTIETQVQDITTKRSSNGSCDASIQADLSEIQASVSKLQSRSSFTHSDYTLTFIKATWLVARDYCINTRNERLVSIQSTEELEFVQGLIRISPFRNQCIGYHGYWTEGNKSNNKWIWGATDERVAFKWEDGEPSGNGNCVELSSDNHLLNDKDCSTQQCFICEK